MMRTFGLPSLIGLATTVLLATSASYQPLDLAATAAISGKCFTTVPQSCGSKLDRPCGSIKCADQGWVFSDWQCPPVATEVHIPANNSTPLCRDMGDNGASVACNSTKTYHCGTAFVCGAGSDSCAKAGDGCYYCLGPFGNDLGGGPTSGATANSQVCPRSAVVSGTGKVAQRLVIPGVLQVVAAANGANFDPFR